MRHRISMSRFLLAAILTLLWIRPRTSATLFIDIGVLILLYLVWPALAELAWSAGDRLATRFERWWDDRGFGVIEDDRAQADGGAMWAVTKALAILTLVFLMARELWLAAAGGG